MPKSNPKVRRVKAYRPHKLKKGCRCRVCSIKRNHGEGEKIRKTRPLVNEDGWTNWYPLYREMEAECCDCGLVHVLQIRVTKNKVQWRAARKESLPKPPKKTE